MRAFATIAAIFFALTAVNMTGNYYRIRWYLAAHLIHMVTLEGFLMADGDPYSTTYRWLYIALTVPILLTAAAITLKTYQSVPAEAFGHFVCVPATLMAIGLYLSPWQPHLMSGFYAVTAALLGLMGIQTRAASEYMEHPRHAAPYKTIGLVWILQSFMFFLLAAGINTNPQGWNRVGDWLPAAIVIGGTCKLGYDVLTEGRNHERNQSASVA